MSNLRSYCDTEALVVLEWLHAATTKSILKSQNNASLTRKAASTDKAASPGGGPVLKKAKKAVIKKPVHDGQQHIKSRLLGELEAITTAMLKGASKGGTAPLKLLWELGKMNEDPTAKPRRREATLSTLLMKELHKKAAGKPVSVIEQ